MPAGSDVAQPKDQLIIVILSLFFFLSVFLQKAARSISGLVRRAEAAPYLKAVLRIAPSILSTYVDVLETDQDDYRFVG